MPFSIIIQNIVFSKQKNYYINNIIKFFNDKFKGMKSLEFKLWKKADYYKDNCNTTKILKLSDISLKIKNKNTLNLNQKRQFSLVSRPNSLEFTKLKAINNKNNLRALGLNLNLLNYSTGADSGASPNNIKPVMIYLNADTLKLQIIKENRDKSGIYRWTNLINGKSYIGSSSNLGKRFYRYYSIEYLTTTLTRTKSSIYSSLLKNGGASSQILS